jgi:hypothetical protein
LFYRKLSLNFPYAKIGDSLQGRANGPRNGQYLQGLAHTYLMSNSHEFPITGQQLTTCQESRCQQMCIHKSNPGTKKLLLSNHFKNLVIFCFLGHDQVLVFHRKTVAVFEVAKQDFAKNK